MTHVSRPLIALLLATVVFFALWMVALKPKGSTGGGKSSGQSLGQLQSDLNAAHQAVSTANGASARAGADPAAPSTTVTTAHPQAVVPSTRLHPAQATGSAKPAHAPRTVRTRTGTGSAVTRLTAVQGALHSHKVLALLFYNPAGADDQAVRQELGTVPAHGGRVFKLAVPLNEINSYLAIIDQVPVNVSPTLVLVAPNGQADEIVGYADPFEISQRVDDALALPR